MNYYATNYGGAIWTKTAIDKMTQRGIPQGLAWDAFAHPDDSWPGKHPNTTDYRKRIDGHLIVITATKTPKNEWLIISAWANPPFGKAPSNYPQKKTKFDYKTYNKASFWGQLWINIKYLFSKS